MPSKLATLLILSCSPRHLFCIVFCDWRAHVTCFSKELIVTETNCSSCGHIALYCSVVNTKFKWSFNGILFTVWAYSCVRMSLAFFMLGIGFPFFIGTYMRQQISFLSVQRHNSLGSSRTSFLFFHHICEETKHKSKVNWNFSNKNAAFDRTGRLFNN